MSSLTDSVKTLVDLLPTVEGDHTAVEDFRKRLGSLEGRNATQQQEVDELRKAVNDLQAAVKPAPPAGA